MAKLALSGWGGSSETGDDYPHIHQPASTEQLRRANRCRVQGARVKLEADVRGVVR